MLKKLAVIGSIVLGLALTVQSARSKWWRVPAGFTPTTQGAPLEVELIQPQVEPYFKMGCLVVGLVLSVVLIFRKDDGEWARLIVAHWLLLLLIFPYLVTVWDARVSAQAARLQMQHENLTWLGGDIYTNQEFIDSNLKSKVYAVDSPRRLVIFDLPITPFWDLDLNRLLDLVEWLGYTESYCQFIGKGWIYALIGTGFIMAALCVAEHEHHRERIARVTQHLVFGGIIACTIAWSLPFIAGGIMSQGEGYAAKGDYARALDCVERAGQFLPVLREDTYYIVQVGVLSYYLGQTDRPEAMLYYANLLEREGRLIESAQKIKAVISHPDASTATRREACRSLLRASVHAMNSGRNEIAVSYCFEVLEKEPCNLKAIFIGELACLRTGQDDTLTDFGDRVRAIYTYFQTPGKKPILSFSNHNRFVAALHSGDLDEAVHYHRLTIRP